MRSTPVVVLATLLFAAPALAQAEPGPSQTIEEDGATSREDAAPLPAETVYEPTSSPAPATPPPVPPPSAGVSQEEPPPVATEGAPEPVDDDDDDRSVMSERRGPYFSGALGFGMPIHWGPYQGVSESYDGTGEIRSPGFNAGFSVGGAPARGFVLGFTLDTNVGPATYNDHWRQDGGFTGVDRHSGRAHAIGAGFFLQGYMRNFFIRAGASGMGLFYIDGSSSGSNESTGGMGGDFALGAHFPVAPKAALGFSAGVRGAFWKYDHDDYRGRVFIVQPMLRFEAVVF